MNYEEFKEKVYQGLLDVVSDNIKVEQKTVNKNNGVILDAIAIHMMNEDISPCLYVDYYYEKYNQGMTITEIIEDMINVVNDSKLRTGQKFLNSSKKIFYFDEIRSTICYKLVNAKKNEDLLNEVPHKIFLDLAIVYFVVCKINDDGTGTVLVRNSMVNKWNYSIDELHEIAVENTMRLFPTQIQSMEAVISSMIGMVSPSEEDTYHSQNRMFVLSNTQGIHGASTILYPNLMMQFVSSLSNKPEKVVILPSSIHELILLPMYTKVDVLQLKQMVRDINETQVAREEVLSNTVYYYSLEDDAIKILEEDTSNAEE